MTDATVGMGPGRVLSCAVLWEMQNDERRMQNGRRRQSYRSFHSALCILHSAFSLLELLLMKYVVITLILGSIAAGVFAQNAPATQPAEVPAADLLNRMLKRRRGAGAAAAIVLPHRPTA